MKKSKILALISIILAVSVLICSSISAADIPAATGYDQALINICDFGAIPNDGKDDTTAFMLTVNSSTKESIYVPPGTYNITWKYSEGLIKDIVNGAKIYFNYSIGEYTSDPIEIDTSELPVENTVILEGFNADRLSSELSYFLSAEYGENKTAKLEEATQGKFTAANELEEGSEISNLMNALKADNAITEVRGEMPSTEHFATKSIKADIKAGTMTINFVASNELITKLAENNTLARNNKLTVTIEGLEPVVFNLSKLTKSTTINISGMSFEQLYGKVTVKLEFEYPEASDKNFEAVLGDFEGSVAVNATETDAAKAFAAYMTK